MICTKCGTENKTDICRKCGAVVNKNRGVDHSLQRDKIGDLERFIGKNANKIANKPVNWAAGFLRPFYLVYRREYALGILQTFFELFPYIIGFPNPYILIGYRLINLFFWTSFFNPIYIKHAEEKIKKLKQRKEENKIEAKGGTKSFHVALYVLCLYVLFFVWLLYKWYKNKIWFF